MPSLRYTRFAPFAVVQLSLTLVMMPFLETTFAVCRSLYRDLLADFDWDIDQTLLGSAQYWIQAEPLVDSLLCGVVIGILWAIYFIVIARIRQARSNVPYSLAMMTWDLAVVVLFFFVARSVGNVAEKALVDADTVWLGIFAIVVALNIGHRMI